MAPINFTCPNELSPTSGTDKVPHKENAAPQHQQTHIQETTQAGTQNPSTTIESTMSYAAVASMTATKVDASSQPLRPALRTLSQPTTSAPANIGRPRAPGLSTRLASTPPRPSRWQHMEDIFLTKPSSPSPSHPTNDHRPENGKAALETPHSKSPARRLQSESKHRALWDDTVLAESNFTPGHLRGLAKDTVPLYDPAPYTLQQPSPQPLPSDHAIDAWLTSTENASDTSSDEWTGDEDFLPRTLRERHRWRRVQRKRAQRRQAVYGALAGATSEQGVTAEATDLEATANSKAHMDDTISVDHKQDSWAEGQAGLMAMADGPMSVAFRERLEALRSPVVGAGRFTRPPVAPKQV